MFQERIVIRRLLTLVSRLTKLFNHLPGISCFISHFRRSQFCAAWIESKRTRIQIGIRKHQHLSVNLVDAVRVLLFASTVLLCAASTNRIPSGYCVRAAVVTNKGSRITSKFTESTERNVQPSANRILKLILKCWRLRNDSRLWCNVLSYLLRRLFDRSCVS